MGLTKFSVKVTNCAKPVQAPASPYYFWITFNNPNQQLMKRILFALLLASGWGIAASAQAESVASMPTRNGGTFRYELQAHSDEISYAHEGSDEPDEVNLWNIQVVRNAFDGENANTGVSDPNEKARLERKLSDRRTMGDITDNDAAEGRSAMVTPLVDAEWQATYNASGSGVPDGACAVSGAGTVVTSNNTHVEIYDEDGNTLMSKTEDDFWSALSPTANIYDPRVVYNTFQNRFVLIALHGSSSTLSEIFIAYSKVSNPDSESDWWFYTKQGNIGNPSVWFDWPSLAYGQEDIFITGNLYDDAGNFQRCMLRQLDMNDGFNGDPVGGVYWDDVEQSTAGNPNAFTVVPVSYPFGQYGPGIYCVSAGRSGSQINYFRVDDNLSDPGDPSLSAFAIDVPDWEVASAASQSGSARLLDTGRGMRVNSAFYGGDGVIHLAHTVSRNDSNEAGIYYHVVDTDAGTAESKLFGLDGFDYAYPAIAPWASNSGSWDGGVMVAFLRSGSTIFPQFRAVHVDADLNFSGSILVQAGSSPISANTTGTNRWGDYLGIHYRESQSRPEVWAYGQYGNGNDHANWVAQIVESILGCTDSSACNFDPDATENDGSCDYQTCAGCTNETACNYNANATIDDGSCTYPGCADFFACNYDSSAGCDDGSCCYGTCITIDMELDGLFGGNDMDYTITDNATGEVVLSGTNSFLIDTQEWCIDPGCYTFDMVTEMSTAEWTLRFSPVFFLIGVDYTIFSGTGDFSGEFIVGDGGETAGCTDSLACNFDPNAVCDNGSCCYENCLVINQTDTFGDGWNDNIWEVVDPATDEVVESGTMEDGETASDIACLEAGCYIFRINTDTGLFASEIGWTLEGIDGDPISGDGSTQTFFTIGGGGTDYGCTDAAACNYSSLAICDDGNCCYTNCGELVMNDGFGDGWNGATLQIKRGDELIQEFEFTSGSQITYPLCLESGCYTVLVSEGSFPGEISWMITMQGGQILGGGAPYSEDFSVNAAYGCTDAAACNYSATATCDDGTCTFPGCTNSNACNYDPSAGCDDGSCHSDCYGCTYPDATNYDSTASTDDGTCSFVISTTDCPQDLDGNGEIGTGDLLELLGNFGTVCSVE